MSECHDGRVALLGGERGRRRGDQEAVSWKKVVVGGFDGEEVKKQVYLAVPMIVTNGSYYLITLLSVMFAGHLGQLELASSSLANSWSFVTGFSFMVGISGAVETLCGQGFGAKLYNMLGIYLQSCCIISFIFSIMISILWWYTEPILILLHQTPEIAQEAAIYMRYLIPAIFAFGTIQNTLRFLQTQSVVVPLIIFSLLPLLMHFGLTYVLVYCTSLGFIGAPIATSITMWISMLMMIVYVVYSKKFEQTWQGLSMEAFCHVFTTLKLALSSAAMVCLEYWAYEILVLLAGLLPDAETSTSLVAMCVNTSAISFNLVYGMGAAVSTRVSNELGARRLDEAKHATWVALKLTIVAALIVVLVLGFGHDIWAGFFSDDTHIIKAFASITPLICISVFFDSLQNVFSGVSRGCGWQHLVMFINLGVYYLIALPVSSILAFVVKLQAKGLWIGIICGLLAQVTALLLITVLRKWRTLELSPSHQGNLVLV